MVAEKRHAKVKRTIEALVERDVIASPQVEEKPRLAPLGKQKVAFKTWPRSVGGRRPGGGIFRFETGESAEAGWICSGRGSR